MLFVIRSAMALLIVVVILTYEKYQDSTPQFIQKLNCFSLYRITFKLKEGKGTSLLNNDIMNKCRQSKKKRISFINVLDRCNRHHRSRFEYSIHRFMIVHCKRSFYSFNSIHTTVSCQIFDFDLLLNKRWFFLHARKVFPCRWQKFKNGRKNTQKHIHAHQNNNQNGT